MTVAALCAVVVGCQRSGDLRKVANLADAKRIREALVGEGGSAAAANEPVGTGWATLKGAFTYDGAPPTMPPYDVNKDQAVCMPGGTAPPQQLLVVDPETKGIANVAIYARRVSRVHEDARPSDDEAVFDQEVCVFLTHVMGFTVGQPVAIKNSDPIGHNTKIEGQNYFNQTIEAGGSVPWSAQREEALPVEVKCSIHPWMIAHMLPRENRYFAVTAADGSFEIPNLPAGEELEIQVWHESAAGSNGSLVVESDLADTLKWDRKGRFKIKLEENQTRDLPIVVPPSAFTAG